MLAKSKLQPVTVLLVQFLEKDPTVAVLPYSTPLYFARVLTCMYVGSAVLKSDCLKRMCIQKGDEEKQYLDD